jgi:hypothetical protein
MITLLTSELNRINQGCGDGFGYRNPETGLLKYSCNKERLCPKCQKEKETLKKVSIMWADFVEDYIKNRYDEINNCDEGIRLSDCYKCETIRAELALMETRMKPQEIKSLMEKA